MTMQWTCVTPKHFINKGLGLGLGLGLFPNHKFHEINEMFSHLLLLEFEILYFFWRKLFTVYFCQLNTTLKKVANMKKNMVQEHAIPLPIIIPICSNHDSDLFPINRPSLSHGRVLYARPATLLFLITQPSGPR